MSQNVSKQTVVFHLPIIQAIHASYDVQFAKHPTLEKLESLNSYHLEKEFGGTKLLHAMDIINLWLKDSDFKTEHFKFFKLDKDAKWVDMLGIINEKISEYSTSDKMTEITISSSGRISRKIGDQIFSHDFKGDGFKSQIISLLIEHDGYMETKDIQKTINSKSIESVRKTIGSINATLEEKLKLPKSKKFIYGSSGYRINEIYNAVNIK